jgi:hypothetical protein
LESSPNRRDILRLTARISSIAGSFFIFPPPPGQSVPAALLESGRIDPEAR